MAQFQLLDAWGNGTSGRLSSQYVSSCSIGLTCPVRRWVVGELEFIGRQECVATLQSYWSTGTVNDLAQILEFAQFPKPLGDDVQV